MLGKSTDPVSSTTATCILEDMEDWGFSHRDLEDASQDYVQKQEQPGTAGTFILKHVKPGLKLTL